MEQVQGIGDRSSSLVANALTDAVLQARMLDLAICGLGAELEEGGIGQGDVDALREEVRKLLLTLKRADGLFRACPIAVA
jgi:hypothetical protein